MRWRGLCRCEDQFSLTKAKGGIPSSVVDSNDWECSMGAEGWVSRGNGRVWFGGVHRFGEVGTWRVVVSAAGSNGVGCLGPWRPRETIRGC
jgi:hypothetical protein